MSTKSDEEYNNIKILENNPESYLITYTRHLERRLRVLETEKQLLEAERLKLDKRLNMLQGELERLRQPPLMVGTITDILSDERAIVRSSSGPTFVVNISKNLNVGKIEPGMKVGLNQRTLTIVEILPESVDPLIQGMEVIENVPDIDYSDIGGLIDQINEIKETVELPLLKPELFKAVGITPPKGILLYGPPGTGKTMVVKAVAHRTNATFIRLIGSELVQKFIGEGAKLVREVFQLARKKAPSIVFIDELDAIGSYRLQAATSGDREVQRTLMQLLAELDGFNERGDIKIIGATNRIDIIDPALLRPGRFDRLIEFPLPDINDREIIFKIHCKNLNISDDVDFKNLAKLTEGATGADIKSIVTEAGMFAIREERIKVTPEYFHKAINKVLKRKEQNEIKFYMI